MREKILFLNAVVLWQLGEWSRLASISEELIRSHPKRDELALYVAAGHSQLGGINELRRLANLAMEWECSKRHLSQILISGAQNSLGCVYSVLGCSDKAKFYFNESIQTGMPEGKVGLVGEAREQHQIDLLKKILQAKSNSNL